MTVRRSTTMLDKIWASHVVTREPDHDLIYADVHLVHEMTSPEAFAGLRRAGRGVRRPDLTFGTEDHIIPTRGGESEFDDEAKDWTSLMRENCAEFGVPLARFGGRRQGIVHVIGPEFGISLPGTVIVCGDSHTSTHGAFGALGFGIGTSQVEHVLATQTLPLVKPRSMEVRVAGELPSHLTAKDLILATVAVVGTNGGRGCAIEYTGPAIRGLSMEGRMTLCNMSIEMGARAGMVAPDDTTFRYLQGRSFAPRGADWDEAVTAWSQLRSDDGAVFDRTVVVDAADLTPWVTWGTTPAQGVPIDGMVPDPDQCADQQEREDCERALSYMGLTPGTLIREVPVERVFIGSCTNGRLEDLRAAAEVLRGRSVAHGLSLLVAPGSAAVKRAAEAEGLDRVFREAGGVWGNASCSMCVGINGDLVPRGERCASTSNRSFESRQGPGSRTHLVSPQVAAATAVAGHFASVEDL